MRHPYNHYPLNETPSYIRVSAQLVLSLLPAYTVNIEDSRSVKGVDAIGGFLFFSLLSTFVYVIGYSTDTNDALLYNMEYPV